MRLFLLLFLITRPIYASCLPPSADEISFDVYKIGKHRDSYFPEDEERFDKGAAFNLNLRALCYLFWENRVHTAGTRSQVRETGWEYRMGIDLGKYLQVFHYHHSRHILERERDSKSFPLSDFYGIRIYFVGD